MTSAMRELLHSLPPELRNEIYNYLSAPDAKTSPLTFGLPLKLKTFECKHTTIQICPVHYGSTGILSLQPYRFQEASEYNSWLLNNAVELKIGVAFKGRVNNFVQQDWDQKLEAHLRKLAKQYPWLKKVARYDVQVLWNPIDGVLKSRKSRRTAGQIVRNMTATLTSLAHRDEKTKRGELKLKLCLDHSFATWSVTSATMFGFEDVLSPPADTLADFKRQTREVWKEAKKPAEMKTRSRLLLIPSAKPEQRGVIEAGRDLVKWTVGTEGILLMKKHLLNGRVTRYEAGFEEEKGSPVDHVALSLLGECLSYR
ncbi:hypothetical protein HBI56_003550 [Parastagonospora nodorum]|nr:hypothetical protein HBH92_004370 [Parastagonospora nodorum]KAH4455079.1 hypothetical protein HBH93_004350 [Parastagonospora nodorum]KAH4468084.1 hypothetical protein HBH91_018250 [Parastagonospora nodorum]KAH4516694.1 hypothetical protein HBH89_019590 [Parastagonospora nodorum]KAH4554531.1 hypothetical protein HBH85_011630 [Parastagonospora nodorum]